MSLAQLLNARSILDELKASLLDDVPTLESTNHLLPLDLPAELCFYDGGPMRAFVRSAPEQPIIRANRQKLREVLSTGVNIEWNRSARSIEEVGQQVKLVFDDGEEVVGDVLIGADGAGSFGMRATCLIKLVIVTDERIVRNHLVPQQKPCTLPAGVINGEVTLTGDEFKHQLQLAHSAYVAAADNFHLYAGLKEVAPSGDSACFYWFLNFYDVEASKEPFWTATATKQEMHEFALEKSKALSSTYSRIVHLTSSNDIKAPPIVFRDLLLDDDAIPAGRITLLGDAAHPMAPCKSA